MDRGANLQSSNSDNFDMLSSEKATSHAFKHVAACSIELNFADVRAIRT